MPLLTGKAKKERFFIKKGEEAEKRAIRSEATRKSRAKKKAEQSEAAMNESCSSAGYSTDTSVATTATDCSLKAPPTPPMQQAVTMITPSSLPTMPMTPRAQGRSHEVPRTPLTHHQQSLMLKIHERKEARRIKAMELIAASQKQADEQTAAHQKQADEQTAAHQLIAEEQTAAHQKQAALGLFDLEAKGDEYDGACIQALVHGLPLGDIPEEMEEEGALQPMNLSELLADAKPAAKPAELKLSKPSSGMKRKSSPSSEGETKDPRKRPPRPRKVVPLSREIVPVFATRKLGGVDIADIMRFEKTFCPDRVWRFDLLKHITAIDGDLQKEKPMARKYLLAGSRDPTMCLLTQLGIPPPKDQLSGNISIPSFTLHVLEEGIPSPEHVFTSKETENGLDIFKLPIGKRKKYTWKGVGPSHLDIKILQSHWRHSATSISKMSELDKELAENAVVWFPPPFNMNTSNPFEHFMLKLPATGDEEEDEIVVDLHVFKKARRAVLVALINERVAQDPNWGADLDTMGKRQLVWNAIYLNDDDDAWYQGLLHPAMIEALLDWFELDGVENARDLVSVEAKRSLEVYRPKMLEAFEESNYYGHTTKHFKIFPENQELHPEYLRESSIYHINAFVGKAVDVFPKPTGEARVEGKRSFQENFSYEDIPVKDRTRPIAADDPLNDDRATDADAFGPDG